jgi:hypothetical protein
MNEARKAREGGVTVRVKTPRERKAYKKKLARKKRKHRVLSAKEKLRLKKMQRGRRKAAKRNPNELKKRMAAIRKAKKYVKSSHDVCNNLIERVVNGESISDIVESLLS